MLLFKASYHEEQYASICDDCVLSGTVMRDRKEDNIKQDRFLVLCNGIKTVIRWWLTCIYSYTVMRNKTALSVFREMIVYKNPLHDVHMHKNKSSCLFSCFNGDNVWAKQSPSGYNYNITDKNLRVPLRFPQFSSEGQARGITANYRLSFSHVTWYLNGQGPPCYQITLSYMLYVYTAI